MKSLDVKHHIFWRKHFRNRKWGDFPKMRCREWKWLGRCLFWLVSVPQQPFYRPLYSCRCHLQTTFSSAVIIANGTGREKLSCKNHNNCKVPVLMEDQLDLGSYCSSVSSESSSQRSVDNGAFNSSVPQTLWKFYPLYFLYLQSESSLIFCFLEY